MIQTGKIVWMALALVCGMRLPVDLSPASFQEKQIPDVVYVGTPYDVVSAMLKLAHVKKEDLVYDLGCGDGRMIVLAAKKYSCHGIGYDLDPERVSAATRNVKNNQVEQLVRIVRADLFTLDFSDADVLSLYLLPEINTKLVPQFEKLKTGSRLVFHDYGLEGFKPDRTLHVTSNEDNVGHTLYLYTIPLKKSQQSGFLRHAPDQDLQRRHKHNAESAELRRNSPRALRPPRQH